MLRKTNTDPPSHKVIGPEKGSVAAESSAVKRPAGDQPAVVEDRKGPDRKRAKISWP